MCLVFRVGAQSIHAVPLYALLFVSFPFCLKREIFKILSLEEIASQ